MKFRKDGYNITRKAYKKLRHIKKWERYKKRCIKFYREHPAEFVEECFGVKLALYQKMALTKTASQSQVGITCWNRANVYGYSLKEDRHVRK